MKKQVGITRELIRAAVLASHFEDKCSASMPCGDCVFLKRCTVVKENYVNEMHKIEYSFRLMVIDRLTDIIKERRAFEQLRKFTQS